MCEVGTIIPHYVDKEKCKLREVKLSAQFHVTSL